MRSLYESQTAYPIAGHPATRYACPTMVSTPIPEFSLRSLAKRYGHRTVLRDLTLDIVPGEIVLLLGENGAGKSTLLRLLAALTRPSDGELLFRGLPLKGEAAQGLRRDLGVLSYEAR